MRWPGRRESSNLEDRRGVSGGQVAVGGGIIGVIVLLINMFLGGDGTGALNQINNQLQNQTQNEQPAELSARDKEQGEMVNAILVDTEDVWGKLFEDQGKTYEDPKLVLFRDAVQTGCGGATSASGPFYCPEDRKVYIDLAFFDELQSRYGAKGGDFAVAYVIAHEIGHHVQNLLGTSSKVQQAMQQSNERDANRLSVALELQADFYAGIWAHYDEKMNHILEDGDIEEALSAANAVGDDALQQRSQGHVVPDSFTHGTSKQRMYWFKKGFDTGDMSQGDTFAEID